MQTSLNSVLDLSIGGSGDSNVTINDILKEGKFTKQAIYNIINSFGYNYTENSTVKLNITTQLEDLISLIGAG